MDFMAPCRRLAGGRGGVCRVLRLGAGGSGLPAGAGYFAHALPAMQSPAGRSGLCPAAPRAAAHPHSGTGTAYACAGPGANAHSFAHAGTKPYAAAQHRTANRGRRLIRAEQFRHGRGEGSISLSAGSIRNSTACADADLRAAVTTANLPFAVELNSDEPQVLILHTHATETYQTWPDLLYDRSAAARTRNTALNMCAVGAAWPRY